MIYRRVFLGSHAIACASLLALASPALAFDAASRIEEFLNLNVQCRLRAFVSNEKGGLASIRVQPLGLSRPTEVAGGASHFEGGVSNTFPPITTANLEANCSLKDITGLAQEGATGPYATDGYIGVSFEATETTDGDRYAYLAEISGQVATTVTVNRTLVNEAPTVTLGSLSGPDASGNYTVIATLSENSSDFTVASLTLTNTTATVSGSGQNYTIVLSPIADGPASVSIPREGFTDNAGLGNWVASNEVAFVADVTAPTVSIGTATPSLNGAGSVDISITFSESVVGFDSDDLIVSNGVVASITGSGANYTATITATGSGDVAVSIPAGAATDASANGNTASNSLTISNSTVEETQTAIAQFMLSRANQLISNQPNLTTLLAGGGSGRADLSVTRAGGNFHLATPTDTNNGLWAKLNGSWSNEDTRETQYVFGALGSHYAFSPELLVGSMVELDYLRQDDGPAKVEGQGWMAGLYAVARAPNHPLFIDGRVLYGQTVNDISPLGTYTDRFDTDRWLAQLKVSGELMYGATTVVPSLQLSYTTDDQHAYTDSLDNLVPAQSVELGQAEFAVDFSHDVAVKDPHASLELTGGIAAIGSSTNGTGHADLIVPEYEGGRAKLKMGVNYTLQNGGTLALDTFYDGIGTSDYESYGLQVGFNLAF